MEYFRTCQHDGCGRDTSEAGGKPYCGAHLDRMPYVLALLADEATCAECGSGMGIPRVEATSRVCGQRCRILRVQREAREQRAAARAEREARKVAS